MLNTAYKISTATEKTVIRKNLQVYLDANKLNSYPGSGNTWYDLSGNAKNAELTNTAYATVGTAKCLHINNVTQAGDTKIYFGNVKSTSTTDFSGRGLTSNLSEFCLMIFLYPTYTTNNLHIYNESRAAFWQNTITLTNWYTRDASTGETGGRNNDLSFSVPINQWTCVTANYSVSNSLKSFYINTSLVASSSTSVDTITTQRAARGSIYTTTSGASEIGAAADGSVYRGYIGNFLFYNSALTADEIYYNFNILRRLFSI